ncbi:MAG: GIY-YIG nuclease family protein [Planctomycetota bacterium]|nr:GIY-YIG nuclease family protein [Planctomycetota bacterium]
MTYYLYILQSLKDKKLYIGVTKNVEDRVRQHNEGITPSTRYRRPFILIHTELFQDESAALKRERYLKSLKGSIEKKKILEQYKARESNAPVAQLDRATDF